MTETPDTPATEPETASEATDFDPITSKQQLDKIIGAARKNDRTKISELQAKAEELDRMKSATMSEAEKATERIRALETELQTERHNNLRRDVAFAKGVPAERITGATREELEASADDLLAFVAEKANAQPAKKPAVGLKSGASNNNTSMDPKQRAAEMLRQWSAGSR